MQAKAPSECVMLSMDLPIHQSTVGDLFSARKSMTEGKLTYIKTHLNNLPFFHVIV